MVVVGGRGRGGEARYLVVGGAGGREARYSRTVVAGRVLLYTHTQRSRCANIDMSTADLMGLRHDFSHNDELHERGKTAERPGAPDR